ncbi:hypothetical protein [Saccharopolyspora griseoalba]|uniref:Lipoprotein n=1 Tax=Saccharopolyspora griseoalba TaxID=1431848 RepID=A0ABW2LRU5_9PSEU
MAAAGAVMAVTMTGCAGGSGQEVPPALQGKPAEKAVADPKAVAQEYADMTAAFYNSRGEKLGGVTPANEAEVRDRVGSLACDKIAEGMVGQWKKFGEMRRQHPNPNDEYWAGSGNVKTSVSDLKVNGSSGTFVMTTGSVEGMKDKKGNLTLERQQDGRWKVCVNVPPPPK